MLLFKNLIANVRTWFLLKTMFEHLQLDFKKVAL